MSHLRMNAAQYAAAQARAKPPALKLEEKAEKPKENKAPSAARSSVYESWLANQLKAAGLPEPATQFRWLDERQYVADLAYPPLLIEIDGAAHRIRGRFMDDIHKNQAALLNGYWLLRVATSQVRDGEAVNIIRKALERVQAYGTTFNAKRPT